LALIIISQINYAWFYYYKFTINLLFSDGWRLFRQKYNFKLTMFVSLWWLKSDHFHSLLLLIEPESNQVLRICKVFLSLIFICFFSFDLKLFLILIWLISIFVCICRMNLRSLWKEDVMNWRLVGVENGGTMVGKILIELLL
jgi:hypothetical protein